MPTVGSLEFQRKFGEFQHQAQREPVEITRHGRREFVLFIGRAQTLDDYVFSNLGFMLLSTAYLVGLCILAHRVTLARMMVTQYPWIYERAGLFSWRAKA